MLAFPFYVVAVVVSASEVRQPSACRRGDDLYAVERYSEAAAAWQSGAQAKLPRCLAGIGMMMDAGVVFPKDHRGGAAYHAAAYRAAFALPDDPEALFTLGTLYQHGRGVAADALTAVGYYQKASRLGLAEATYRLAGLYDDGLGVQRDRKMALRLYREAADKGEIGAQYQLGVLAEEGDGIPRDLPSAYKSYRVAADKGLPDAQYKVGVFLRKGLGVPQKPEEAFTWFTKAAQQGYAVAYRGLGEMYAHGEGTEQNLSLAYRWLLADKTPAGAQALAFLDQEVGSLASARGRDCGKMLKRMPAGSPAPGSCPTVFSARKDPVSPSAVAATPFRKWDVSICREGATAHGRKRFTEAENLFRAGAAQDRPRCVAGLGLLY
ncbi:MAG: sel1 repeat family protein [Elusimicrobia bacterium]|nr:sel1 repeat family protein [Elusimicrobiota bacterium]